jgi:hypothetical protein
MTHTIVYLTEIDRAREYGLPWRSVDAARWEYRTRHDRGTARAFVRVGRRVAVYPDVYHTIMRGETADRERRSA